MKRVTTPKFVKTANMFCITVFEGKKQKTLYFDTEVEARAMYWELLKQK